MIRMRVPALLVTAAAFLLISCSGNKNVPTKQTVSAPDPQWVTSISQHSNGAISRHSPVRVLFTNDVVPQERVGTDASANITITPAVKATARGAGNPGGANSELPASWAPNRSRPLCAYPRVATYKGSGSMEDASSFACR